MVTINMSRRLQTRTVLQDIESFSNEAQAIGYKKKSERKRPRRSAV